MFRHLQVTLLCSLKRFEVSDDSILRHRFSHLLFDLGDVIVLHIHLNLDHHCDLIHVKETLGLFLVEFSHHLPEDFDVLSQEVSVVLWIIVLFECIVALLNYFGQCFEKDFDLDGLALLHHATHQLLQK